MRGCRLRTAAPLAAAALALAGCGEPAEPSIAFRNVSTEVAYVGQDACRQCHLEKFGTYVRTGMGRALYPLTPDEIVEDFTENNEFVDARTGLHYRMERRDDRFYQAQFFVDSKGREIARDEREMTLVIGSNHHARSYVVMVGDKWFQAPACWYPEESRWEMCPGFEVKNEYFHRELGLDCLHCHNGVMKPKPGVRNAYEEPIPHGIGCERCHGPGELHVARWRAHDVEPRGEPDPTIVNPRRLPPDKRIQVCFQCHLGDAKATENVLRHGKEPRGFRPGMNITEVVMPFHYKEQTRYGFGLSAQVDRLVLSRCYKESGGRIECLTCHNPHVTVYSDQRPDDYFRQKCLGCHVETDCAAPAAERRRTTPAADDCVQCHMRRAEPDDQRFTEFTDHWIRRDIDIAEPDRRSSYEIEPVLPERAAALPKGEFLFYRGHAGFLLARDAPEARRQEIWKAAEKDLETAIAKGFDNVESWFFLGKTRHDMGRLDTARAAFERAVERDPTHHDAVFALAQSLLAAGDTRRALELFSGMLERDPADPMALAEIGRVHTAEGRIPEAIDAYGRALAEEPWTASLHLNLGMLLASQGRFDEAAARGEDAVRLAPADADAWEFYAKVMTAAGREDEAAEGRAVFARLGGRR